MNHTIPGQNVLHLLNRWITGFSEVILHILVTLACSLPSSSSWTARTFGDGGVAHPRRCASAALGCQSPGALTTRIPAEQTP
jgi:hypothetical protein